MPARISLAEIDQTQFAVTPFTLPEPLGAVVLVVPVKTKHRWTPDECHLRSLVCAPDGTVLSSGFPKFFNFGEHAAHDAEFIAALAAGSVEFPEKIDGSLLIVDRIRGAANVRTRGRPSVADDFADTVNALIAGRYPALTSLAADGGDALFEDHSVLFEFTHPAHRIVCAVETPTLTLLGAIDKRTLAPLHDTERLDALARAIGAARPTMHQLPDTPEALVALVKGFVGHEGVVAQFRSPAGALRLLKMKGDWYRTLHALRFGMSPRRAAKLCYLLGVTAMADVPAAFHRLGADYELLAHLTPDLEAYFAARDALTALAIPQFALVDTLAAQATDRKDLVDRLRAALAARFEDRPAQRRWFATLLARVDGKHEQVARLLEADPLGESAITLQAWDRDRAAEMALELTGASLAAEDG